MHIVNLNSPVPRFSRQVVRKGDGVNAPRSGDTVKCSYSESFEFFVGDLSRSLNEPFTFMVGADDVDEILSRLVTTMSLGERRVTAIIRKEAHSKRSTTFYIDLELVQIRRPNGEVFDFVQQGVDSSTAYHENKEVAADSVNVPSTSANELAHGGNKLKVGPLFTSSTSSSRSTNPIGPKSANNQDQEGDSRAVRVAQASDLSKSAVHDSSSNDDTSLATVRRSGAGPPPVFKEKKQKKDPGHGKFSSVSGLLSYEKMSKLGEGGFGKVYLARHHYTNQLVAMKQISLEKLEASTIVREEAVLKSLENQYIIKLLTSFEDQSFHYLILEFCSGGDLEERIQEKRLSEDEAKAVFLQVVRGVAFMHSCGFAHRDLKPANILYKNEMRKNIKIADFGLSSLKGTMLDPMRTFCGTPMFAAPELLLELPYYGHTADLFSCGVILFYMLFQFGPFVEEPCEQRLFEIQSGVQNQFLEKVSPEVRVLLIGLLEWSPDKRTSLAKLLKTRWFKTTIDQANEKLWLNDKAKANDAAIDFVCRRYAMTRSEVNVALTRPRYSSMEASLWLENERLAEEEKVYASRSSIIGDPADSLWRRSFRRISGWFCSCVRP